MRKSINCNLTDAMYRYPKRKTICKQFSRSPDRHRRTNPDVIDALTSGLLNHLAKLEIVVIFTVWSIQK